MTDVSGTAITRAGLWNNNPALVQLLGLCPLLAVSTTVVNGLGLGLATTAVLIMSNVTVSAVRRLVRQEIRIPLFVLIIASFVTAVELAMNALFHDLYQVLGIFVPLIVTNCTIIGRAEAFASRHDVGRSLVDALSMGAGFMLALVALGALRELIAYGTVFAQAELLFGPAAGWLTVTLIPGYSGFLLAALPPGAFMALGLLIALKNVVDARGARKTLTPALSQGERGQEQG